MSLRRSRSEEQMAASRVVTQRQAETRPGVDRTGAYPNYPVSTVCATLPAQSNRRGGAKFSFLAGCAETYTPAISPVDIIPIPHGASIPNSFIRLSRIPALSALRESERLAEIGSRVYASQEMAGHVYSVYLPEHNLPSIHSVCRKGTSIPAKVRRVFAGVPGVKGTSGSLPFLRNTL